MMMMSIMVMVMMTIMIMVMMADSLLNLLLIVFDAANCGLFLQIISGAVRGCRLHAEQ